MTAVVDVKVKTLYGYQCPICILVPPRIMPGALKRCNGCYNDTTATSALCEPCSSMSNRCVKCGQHIQDGMTYKNEMEKILVKYQTRASLTQNFSDINLAECAKNFIDTVTQKTKQDLLLDECKRR